MNQSLGEVMQNQRNSLIDLFTDTTAILISIVSNSYYGMPRGQININLPPELPIMSFETIEIKMAAVSAKRSITFDFRLSIENRSNIHEKIAATQCITQSRKNCATSCAIQGLHLIGLKFHFSALCLGLIDVLSASQRAEIFSWIL